MGFGSMAHHTKNTELKRDQGHVLPHSPLPKGQATYKHKFDPMNFTLEASPFVNCSKFPTRCDLPHCRDP